MTNSIFKLLSLFKTNLSHKKIFCYSRKTKECIELLNFLWQENLIWGYVNSKHWLKIYFKYQHTQPIINSVKIYLEHINIMKLKNYDQLYPQSLFILKTCKGFASHKKCLEWNFSGLLFLQLN